MLELKNIIKDYPVAGDKVHALKGVSISFRESEFVSVLGPSGCGKTTLLNIIGGLDHYTSGDLLIDGVSTKSYTDRDWDTYRNHRIGFVFQSYNLIPHQTISENVELALNISGVEKKERVRRAHEALDKVGLSGLYNKKPNQLSGGQMQRVAIARALVNEPEILLADEPTGALDSETSVQIMDLIREIAKECLVIMVTHNPELAEKYSTRIIKLLDGEVLSDSNPFDAEKAQAGAAEKTESDVEGAEKESEAEAPKKQKKNASKKSKLSFWSAFKLSAKNLWSKLKRTILVCFAGSIGIIGVATVLAVSSGVQGYIHDMQDDMLSGNPVTISTEAFDMEALMSGMSFTETSELIKNNADPKEGINVQSLIAELAKRGSTATSSIIQNNITKEYLEYVKAMPSENYRAMNVLYGLNLSNNIYTDFELEGKGDTSLSLTAALAIYTDLLSNTEFKDYASYIPMFTERFGQIPDNPDFILSQYDIVSDKSKSKFPTEANEIMIVINSDYSLADLTLAQFGYLSQKEFLNAAYAAVKDTPGNEDAANSYDEELDVTEITYDELMNKKFTWYPNDDVFKGVKVENNPMLGGDAWSGTYIGEAQDDWTDGIELKVTAVLKRKEGVSYGCLSSGFYTTGKFSETVVKSGLDSEVVKYMRENNYGSIVGTKVNGMILSGIRYNYDYILDGESHSGVGVLGSQSAMSQMLGMMQGAMPGGGSSSVTLPDTYSLMLYELGGSDTPNRIAVYPTDFEFKDEVTAYLDAWNGSGSITVNGVELTDREEIKYTDNLELVINMVNDFIDIITYALVAFTALSLVVSTVMIAIITYVSVMERIKEIGVIRSLGGRKRDVSALFIAETFIIGGVSGVLGIAVTYLISLVINLIVGGLVGIYTIASLPILTAFIMILLSIGLTLISGLIPARLAAKKDPVEALRSE